jgi:hypothetical protein
METREQYKDKVYPKVLFYLSIILIIANLLDALTTYLALPLAHTYEANPSMAWLLNNFGLFGYVIKLLFTYLVLQVKYCPLYYTFNFMIRKSSEMIKDIGFFIYVLFYLFMTYLFLKVSLENIGFLI